LMPKRGCAMNWYLYKLLMLNTCTCIILYDKIFLQHLNIYIFCGEV
jgi:hypothetical protein